MSTIRTCKVFNNYDDFYESIKNISSNKTKPKSNSDKIKFSTIYGCTIEASVECIVKIIIQKSAIDSTDMFDALLNTRNINSFHVDAAVRILGEIAKNNADLEANDSSQIDNIIILDDITRDDISSVPLNEYERPDFRSLRIANKAINQSNTGTNAQVQPSQYVQPPEKPSDTKPKEKGTPTLKVEKPVQKAKEIRSVFNKDFHLSAINNPIIILRTVAKNISDSNYKKVFKLRLGLDNDTGKASWDEIAKKVSKSEKWCERAFSTIKKEIKNLVKSSQIEDGTKRIITEILSFFSKDTTKISILQLTGLNDDEFIELIGILTDEDIELIKKNSFNDYYRLIEPRIDGNRKKKFSPIVLEMLSSKESKNLAILVSKLKNRSIEAPTALTSISNTNILNTLSNLINDYVENPLGKAVMKYRIGFNAKRKKHEKIAELLNIDSSYSTKLYNHGWKKISNIVKELNYSDEYKDCLIQALEYFSRKPARTLPEIIGCSIEEFTTKVLPALTEEEIFLLKQHSYENYLEFILPYISVDLKDRLGEFSFRVLNDSETKRFNCLKSRMQSLAKNPNYKSVEESSVYIDISNITYTDSKSFLIEMFNLLKDPYKSIMLCYFNNRDTFTFNKIAEQTGTTARTVTLTIDRVYEAFKKIIIQSGLEDSEKESFLELLRSTERPKKQINKKVTTIETIFQCSQEDYQNKIEPHLKKDEIDVINKKISGAILSNNESAIYYRVKRLAKKYLNNPNYKRPGERRYINADAIKDVNDPIEIIKRIINDFDNETDKTIISKRVGLYDNRQWTIDEIMKECYVSQRKVYFVITKVYNSAKEALMSKPELLLEIECLLYPKKALSLKIKQERQSKKIERRHRKLTGLLERYKKFNTKEAELLSPEEREICDKVHKKELLTTDQEKLFRTVISKIKGTIESNSEKEKNLNFDGLTDPMEIIIKGASVQSELARMVIYLRIGYNARVSSIKEISNELGISVQQVSVILSKFSAIILKIYPNDNTLSQEIYNILHPDTKKTLNALIGCDEAYYNEHIKPILTDQEIDAIAKKLNGEKLLPSERYCILRVKDYVKIKQQIIGLTDPMEIIIKGASVQSELARRVIYLRIGYNARVSSTKEISSELGISPHQVRVILSKFSAIILKIFPNDNTLSQEIYNILHPDTKKTLNALIGCDEAYYNEHIKPILTDQEIDAIAKKLNGEKLLPKERDCILRVKDYVKIKQQIIGLTDPMEIVKVIVNNEKELTKAIISMLLGLTDNKKSIKETAVALNISVLCVNHQINKFLEDVNKVAGLDTAKFAAGLMQNPLKEFDKPICEVVPPAKIKKIFKDEILLIMDPRERLLIQMRTTGINNRRWTLEEMCQAFRQDEKSIIEEFKVALSHYIQIYNQMYSSLSTGKRHNLGMLSDDIQL